MTLSASQKGMAVTVRAISSSIEDCQIKKGCHSLSRFTTGGIVHINHFGDDKTIYVIILTVCCKEYLFSLQNLISMSALFS